MLISPTEPAKLRALGVTTLYPENYGADILVPRAGGGWVGVQRKERADLMSSLGDGRLGEQIAKLRALPQRHLIIEGELRWTNDGILMGSGKYGREITRDFLDGVLWSIQRDGVWVSYTDSLGQTCDTLVHLEKWWAKEKHNGLATRGPVAATWGVPDSRDYQVHLLTGIPNVGPELAGRIIDRFGGLPFRWRDDVTIETLCEVKGVGDKKAAKIMGVLK